MNERIPTSTTKLTWATLGAPAEFCPTPHQSQINLSGVRGVPYDGEITGICTWTEDEDHRSELIFADKDAVQNALKVFSLKRHVDYRVTRSAEKFIECKCLHHAKDCKWRVRASYRVDLQLWMISRYDGPHSCASTVIAKDHLKLDSDMIVGVIAGLVAEKTDIPISLVVETVKKARGFTVSYKKVWRGKQKAIARVYGSWVASYNKLTAYAAGGRDVPVRQVQALAVDRDVAGRKQEHLSCRVCTRGGGDRICVVVVFVEALRARREGSRENPGTGWQPPLGHNVFCIRHVASNLNSKFRNRAIRALLMKAGHEYIDRGCQRRLEVIRLLNKDAARWIENIPREKWARAYDGGWRYGHMTTNLAECMNDVLKGVRCLPVMALMLATLYKVAEFFNNRRQQVQVQINTGHVLCEELRDTIFSNLEIARICKVTLRNEDLGEFEVEEPYNQQERRPGRCCRVYLGRRLCDCWEFQQLHHPCIHVLAACADVTHEFGLYVDPVYKLETMLMAYSQLFHPIGGEEYWPYVSGRPVMPNPQVLRPPGQPRSTRIRNEMDWKELGNKPKCSLCRVEGHTKKKCPNKKPMQP
ncbi:uncharacterized protein G2W53_013725 [Senna tora]|uniref:SWIM-type domain-containing protein n=1 Tax=Senna tora TaxID=362788 RepID=A0A834TZT4_9FABA|nr:uncharacterized protein G2W53_013725 [Senna tora]